MVPARLPALWLDVLPYLEWRQHINTCSDVDFDRGAYSGGPIRRILENMAIIRLNCIRLCYYLLGSSLGEGRTVRFGSHKKRSLALPECSRYPSLLQISFKFVLFKNDTMTSSCSSCLSDLFSPPCCASSAAAGIAPSPFAARPSYPFQIPRCLPGWGAAIDSVPIKANSMFFDHLPAVYNFLKTRKC